MHIKHIVDKMYIVHVRNIVHRLGKLYVSMSIYVLMMLMYIYIDKIYEQNISGAFTSM